MSTAQMTRVELVTALNRAMRDASSKGVIYSQAVADRLGINSTDLECLDIVVLHGPLAAGELADAIGLTSGAITGVIDRLERAGFVRRERNQRDRRKVLVRALPTIERRVAPLFHPMQRAAMAALEEFSDKELELLLDFFGRASAAATAALIELRTGGKATAKLRRGTRPATSRSRFAASSSSTGEN